MKRKQFVNIALLGGSLIENLRPDVLANAPANPNTGQIYFNTADQKFYGWNGTQWVNFSSPTKFTPEMFGAVGNGTTNDLTALNTMFSAVTNGVIEFTYGKNYRVNGTVSIVSNGDASSNLKVVGYGAKITTTNGDTVPVLKIDNTKRLNIDGLEVAGTVDFTGMWESSFTDCNLKDLRFGVGDTAGDVFDEHYWNRFTRCRARTLHVYTGTLGGDYTEFNSIVFESCLFWQGDYFMKLYGTANLQGVYFNHCDISYQTTGKLLIESQINDGSLNFHGCYLDDETGFPTDTKGININVTGASNVPNSANVQNFLIKEGSRSTTDTLSGVRQGSRSPMSVLNLVKNGDLRHGLSQIKVSAGLTAAMVAGAGYYGNFLRITGNQNLTTDFDAIAAPYTGWYNVTAIAKNTGNTQIITANVINGSEVLYNPVSFPSSTDFVVSSCHVYLTQGQLYKLRIYLQNGVSNTFDVSYVALSFGKTGLLGLSAHPDALKDITIAATDSPINLWQNGDFESSTLPATLVGNGALIQDSCTIVTDAANDQTGNTKLLRYNPVTGADFPSLSFLLNTRFLGSAKQIGKVTLTMRSKPIGGFVNFVLNTGGTDSYFTPVYTLNAWNTFRVTIDVPSNATKVDFKLQMAGAGTAKDLYIDAVTMTLGNVSIPWTPSFLDSTSLVSVTDDYKINVRSFGAIGNGTTNDTLAIQSALNSAQSAGKTVIGNKGDIYLLNIQGTKNFMTSSVTGLPFCVEVPTGVKFDLQGATLKSISDAVLLSNKQSSTELDVDIEIRNGILDGGGTLFNSKPLIFFYGVTGLRFTDIIAQNSTHLLSTFTNLTKAHFDNITAKNIVGNAWQFGLPTLNQEVRDSYIGKIFSFDVTPESEPIFPGSPFIGNLIRCTVDLIFARNVGSGAKIQQGSKDITISTVDIKTTNSSGLNSGFKIQGTSTEKVENVIVDLVKAMEQKGTGLFVENARNVRVNSYIGYGNAITGEYPDIWLAGDNVGIGQATSINSGGTGVLVRADAQNYYIGEANVNECGVAVNSSAVFLSDGSKGTINSIVATDNRATKKMQFGLNISGASCKGFCGNLVVNGLADSSWLAFMGATSYGFGNLALTTSQRNDMIIPTSGLRLFNKTTNQYQYFNGSTWVSY